MATATYTPIATQTLGSAAASITFNSIPGTYTDLRLVLTYTTSASDYLVLQLNGDTATNYSGVFLLGNGGTASSSNATTQGKMFINNPGSTYTLTSPAMATIDVFSYAGATNKSVLSTGAGDLNGSGQVETAASLWRSTAAITSIKLFLAGGNNFATGTIATLWGI